MKEKEHSPTIPVDSVLFFPELGQPTIYHCQSEGWECNEDPTLSSSNRHSYRQYEAGTQLVASDQSTSSLLASF